MTKTYSREKTEKGLHHTYKVMISDSIYIKVDVLIDNYNNVDFSEGFRSLPGKKKLKAFKTLYRLISKNYPIGADTANGGVMFDIEKNEKDGEWLMNNLDDGGFAWYSNNEQGVGAIEDDEIIYWFADSFSNIKKLCKKWKKGAKNEES